MIAHRGRRRPAASLDLLIVRREIGAMALAERMAADH
jgi:hypothetical protein